VADFILTSRVALPVFRAAAASLKLSFAPDSILNRRVAL